MPHALYEEMMVVYGNENNKIVPYFMPSIFVRDDSLSSLFSFLYNARSIKRAHRLFVWSRISTHVHEILSRTRASWNIYGEGKILILWFLCDLLPLSRIGPNKLLFYLLRILINWKNNHIMKYRWRWIPVMWLCNVCVLVCARKRVSFSVFQNTNNNDMHTIVKLANQMFEIPRTVKSVFIPALFPFPEKSHLCEIFCEYCIKYNTKFLTKICQSIFWVVFVLDISIDE